MVFLFYTFQLKNYIFFSSLNAYLSWSKNEEFSEPHHDGRGNALKNAMHEGESVNRSQMEVEQL
jgi:heme-degrading monooxygenase HmoA